MYCHKYAAVCQKMATFCPCYNSATFLTYNATDCPYCFVWQLLGSVRKQQLTTGWSM